MEVFLKCLVFALSQCLVLSQIVPCDITNSRKTCLLAAGFDDYQLATCSSNSILQQNGFSCENSCTDTCWHLCMVEKFNQINGSVSSNCSCKPHFPTLPPWCYTATGHCAFNNCILLKYMPIGCVSSDLIGVYILNNVLCTTLNYFFRYLFCETKIWLDGVRKCLQQYLIDSVIVGTVSCSDLELKGEEAFHSCIQQNYSGRTFYDMAKSKQSKSVTCTPEELYDIITAPSGGFQMLPNNAYDEVYPGIYVGEESIGKSRVGLRDLGITYVVNTAMGKGHFYVNINHVMFQKVGIKFYGFEAMDMLNFQLTPFADFIEHALKEV
eukprot:XP_019920577.1 PREDICTED: uncharacterized protein LOC105322712 [Crassostrea gigas]